MVQQASWGNTSPFIDDPARRCANINQASQGPARIWANTTYTVPVLQSPDQNWANKILGLAQYFHQPSFQKFSLVPRPDLVTIQLHIVCPRTYPDLSEPVPAQFPMA